jgi:hypothetical protein
MRKYLFALLAAFLLVGLTSIEGSAQCMGVLCNAQNTCSSWVATMLEKLGFQALIDETLTIGRRTRVMSLYQFVLAIVLGLYIGFARLHQLRFVARDPLLTGIRKVTQLPGQSVLWRFMASLHRQVAWQLLRVQATLRQRVWAASHVRLSAVTVDTDTTVHTVYGQKMGARKSHNPKNRGKKSYQPILTFCAETRQYL